MSRKRSKSKILSVIAAIVVVFALLTTLSEQGVLPLRLPTWNRLFTTAGLTSAPVDENSPFTVRYLDVGQGDSSFIKTPDGCILIDAGEEGCGETVKNCLNSLGVDTLDYVIATHPHSDHIGGLDEVIRAFKVKNIIMPRLTSVNTPTTQCYENLLSAVKSSGAKVIAARPGAGYALGKAYLMILSPSKQSEDLNDMSVVARVTYGETSFLFTGDAQTPIERELLEGEYADYLKADVLKAGHHGSKTSSGAKFLNKVSPSCIIISCGAGNSYGHPHSEVLKRMSKTQAEILRTDLGGTITVGSDGERLTFTMERE